jgi:hypothetical protein
VHQGQQFEVIATNRNCFAVYCHLMGVHMAGFAASRLFDVNIRSTN